MLDVPKYVVRSEAGGHLSIQMHGKAPVMRRYRARQQRLNAIFGRELPPLLEDLFTLALTVYAVDRFICRQPKVELDACSWQRRMEIQIPVADPARWSQPEVVSLLTDALGFLTEDQWTFTFHPREQLSRLSVIQGVLFPAESPAIALFSGGLDSLAGLSLHLMEGNLESISAFTCSTNHRMLHKQRKLLRELHGRTRARLLRVVVNPQLSQIGHDYDLNERSQRARGFLFNVLASICAVMSGATDIFVYENGIGSINLRLSDAQLGAQSTRATHPVALRKLERFLCMLLERNLNIRLPFIFSTKGQMCERLRETPFANLAAQTVSCDGFPQRQLGPDHCGICSSCLLRRQSLWSGGFNEDCDKERYRHDVVSGIRNVPDRRLAPLWDMLLQADRLGRALWSKTPWQDLVIEYPELQEVRDVLSDDPFDVSARAITEKKLMQLYLRYCSEWENFPARPVGWRFSVPDLRSIA
jgi:7-cyano-7-deazaguanine synthase in queuosine biosynthesis